MSDRRLYPEKLIAILFGLLFLSGCSKEGQNIKPPQKDESIRAADLSFFPEINNSAYTYRDSSGQAIRLPAFLRSNGWNAVRLRLWVDPASGHSGLEEVEQFTQLVKAESMSVWLSIHYSDHWADPGQQAIPAPWMNLPYDALIDSVYNYTYRVCELLQPDIVQIGNEINGGFLWPTGHIDSSAQFHGLLNSGLQAAKDAYPDAQRMIHFAGINPGANWFFQDLENASFDFELIGLSYYPWWHGKDLDQLGQTLEDLHALTSKNTIIAETAYPFTLGWNDWTNNIVGLPEQLIPGFPASIEGQHAYLQQIDSVCENTYGNIGWGYWAPDYVAWRGPQATDGSPWENLALFDFQANALPAVYLKH